MSLVSKRAWIQVSVSPVNKQTNKMVTVNKQIKKIRKWGRYKNRHLSQIINWYSFIERSQEQKQVLADESPPTHVL